METWRLLDTYYPSNAWMNIAVDEAILSRADSASVPTVRFWSNDSAVVVGYSQSANSEADLRLCQKAGIQVARRSSGGGAVYHDVGNLNYTIEMSSNHELVRATGILESYRVLCSGVVCGLKKLGLQASFDPPNSIVLDSKKISGSAQLRRRGRLIHHGTLLVNTDLAMLCDVLNVPEERTGGRKPTSVKRTVTNICNELGVSLKIETVRNTIVQGFEEAYNIRLQPGKLSLEEIEATRKLYETKSSQKAWIFRR